MSQIITISAVTANTPVSIYYCDSMSANCQTVILSADTFPYTFTVPNSASTTDFIIKIVDINIKLRKQVIDYADKTVDTI